MRDASTQDRRRNERAKLLIFREIAKRRRWRHAPWLTATAVITDSHYRFSKRWHVADIKNIAGDQTMVHRWSIEIPQISRVSFAFTSVYVCAIATVVPRLTVAAVATHPHSRISRRWRCRRQILQWRWPANPNGRSNFRNLGLFTFTRSQLTLQRQLRGWWHLPEIAQTADVKNGRRQKHRRRWPGSIEIPHIRKFKTTRSSKASRKTSFCCYERRRDWRHCTLFTFLLSLVTAFAFTFKK